MLLAAEWLRIRLILKGHSGTQNTGDTGQELIYSILLRIPY